MLKLPARFTRHLQVFYFPVSSFVFKIVLTNLTVFDNI